MNEAWDRNTQRCSVGRHSRYSWSCHGPVGHLLVDFGEKPVGAICDRHADELSRGGLYDFRYEIENQSGPFTVVPMRCDVCAAMLWHFQDPNDVYNGPKCPDCKRTAALIDAASRQASEVRVAVDEIVKSQRMFADFNKTIASMLQVKTEMAAKPAKSIVDKVRESPAMKTLEVDATEAAWRMAGSQFVKLAKEPIVALLSRHLGPDDESLRARIAAFLDTELGTAILTGILSGGLSAMPMPPNDVSQRLSRELRVRSMATAGDAIADVLMGPLRQVAVTYLSAPPVPTEPAATLVESTRVEIPVAPVPVDVPVKKKPKKARSVWGGEDP